MYQSKSNAFFKLVRALKKIFKNKCITSESFHTMTRYFYMEEAVWNDFTLDAGILKKGINFDLICVREKIVEFSASS